VKFLINEGDVKKSLYKKEKCFVFDLPRRRFNIECAKRIIGLSDNSSLNFDYVLIPTISRWPLSPRGRLSKMVRSKTMEILQEICRNNKELHLHTEKSNLSLSEIFGIFGATKQ